MATDDQTSSEETVSGDYTPRRRSTYTPPAIEPNLNVLIGEDVPDVSAGTVDDGPELAEAAPTDVFQLPKRLSLTAETLENRLRSGLNEDGTETLPLIELIEQQIALRETDISQFREWEAKMYQLGTPEATAALEQARKAHPDLATPEVNAPEPAVEQLDSAQDLAPEDPAPEASAEVPHDEEQDTREALVAGQRGFVSDVVAEAFAELGIAEEYPNHSTQLDEAESYQGAVESAETESADAEAIDVDDSVAAESDEVEFEAEAENETDQENDYADVVVAAPPLTTFTLIEPDPVPVADEDNLEARVAQHTGETNYLDPNFIPEDDADNLGGPKYTPAVSDEFDAILAAQAEQTEALRDSDNAVTVISIDEAPSVDQTAEEYPAITPISGSEAYHESAQTPASEPARDIPVHTVAEVEPSASVDSAQSSWVETVGTAATPAGGARNGLLSWLWFALGGALLSLFASSTALYGFGLPASQALLALLIGTALSLLPLGVAAAAAKYGLPAMVVSRSIFGVYGNIPLAVIAGLFRIAWLLLLLFTAAVLFTDGALSLSWFDFDRDTLLLSTALVLNVLAGVVVVLGYRVVIWLVGITGGIALLGSVVLMTNTWSLLDFNTLFGAADSDGISLLNPVIQIFVYVGLHLALTVTDIARYRKARSSGSAVAVTLFMATLVTVVFVGYTILLSTVVDLAAVPEQHPSFALVSLMPPGVDMILLLAFVLGVFALAVLSAYSGNLALMSTGVSMKQPLAASLLTVVSGGILVGILMVIPAEFAAIVPTAIAVLSVPMAAWVGMHTAQLILRKTPLDEASLGYQRGVYGAANWVNLAVWIVSSGVGVIFLGNLPYVGALTNVGWSLVASVDGALMQSGIGVLFALLGGFLLVLLSNTPRIRQEEEAAAELQAQSRWLG